MKKIVTIFFLIFLFGNFIYSQGKLKQTEFIEKGFSVHQEFLETKKIVFSSDNLLINISPVDPSSLNGSFTNTSYLSGEFNYTFIEKTRGDYFLKKDGKLPAFANKTNPEILYAGLDWLMDNDIIDESDYSKLSERIQWDFGQTNGVSSSFNPYSINDKYLSIFKTVFVNNTNVPIKFYNKFEILSNENIINPLSKDEIVTLLTASSSFNVAKLINLNRYNLDSALIIPANSSTYKFFATLPIDYNSNSIEIIYNDKDSQKSKWEIKKNKKEINNKYAFYEIEVYPSSWFYENIYVIIRNSNLNAYAAGSKLYVDKVDIDKEISLFIYAIYEKKLFYFPFKFTPHKYLNLEKNRRERLPTDLIQIKM